MGAVRTGRNMKPEEKHTLINRATSLKTMIFGEVAECGDCLIVTNSGGRARYICGYLDNGQVFVEKLDWKTCPV